MASVRCSGCKWYKCLEDFGVKNNGEQYKTCTTCRERNKQYRIKFKADIKNIKEDKVTEIIIKQNKQVKQDKLVNDKTEKIVKDKTNNYNHAAAAVWFNPDIKNIINAYVIGDNTSFKNKFKQSLEVFNRMPKSKGIEEHPLVPSDKDFRYVELNKILMERMVLKDGTPEKKHLCHISKDLKHLVTNFNSLIDNLE